MAFTESMATSNSYEYETPPKLYAELEREFNFDLDPCATDENHKAPHYFTVEQDGLSMDWRNYRSVFMNPPYGRMISWWVRKAYETAQGGNTTVVCLVPARTDTKWWHDYCMKGEIRFIRGRLKFSQMKHNAPFPSAIVIFRGQRS